MLPICAMTADSTATLPQFWLWAVATILLAVVCGFAAGYVYAKHSMRYAVHRAKSRLSTLFALVVESLDAAQQACLVLERFPQMRLTREQTEKLANSRGKLLDSITNIVSRQLEESAQPEPRQEQKPNVEEFQVEWVRAPVDGCTGLPDRSAFDANITALLDAGRRSDTVSGFLLVKVDKLDTLKARFGQLGLEKLQQKLAAVVCRTIRDEDIACRFSNDSLAVLLPAVDAEAGRKLSQTLRSAVRHYNFRIDESGPQVLLTASFGFTCVRPEDHVDLVLNRAGDALARSVRRGRNQLHMHDGEQMYHCRTA